MDKKTSSVECSPSERATEAEEQNRRNQQLRKPEQNPRIRQLLRNAKVRKHDLLKPNKRPSDDFMRRNMASQTSVQMTAGSSTRPVNGGHTRSVLVLTRTMKSIVCDVCL